MIIATERVRRPRDFPSLPRISRPGPCSLCPGHESETPPEVLAYRTPPDAAPDTPGWRVRVVPSKFPALRIEGDLERRGEGLYDLMNGVGAHEVIVASPDHERGLGRLPVTAVEEILRAWRERIADLGGDGRFRSVVVFENHRFEGGATPAHPHSQLIAAPVVPLVVADELSGARAFHDWRERCLFCDILRQERQDGLRMVADGAGVAAFAPFAGRVPFETWILPARHVAAFERIDDTTLRETAAVLGAVLGKLDRALDDPPYRLVLHSAPFGMGESPSYHWHIELLPRLTGLGGFELGSGLPINPLPPEDAARILRDTPG